MAKLSETQRFALDTITLLYGRELTSVDIMDVVEVLGLRSYLPRDPSTLGLLDIVASVRDRGTVTLERLIEELTLALVRGGRGPAAWADQPAMTELEAALRALELPVLDTLATTIAAARAGRLREMTPGFPSQPSRQQFRNVCFVIMPFGAAGTKERARWQGIYRELIKPAVDESGVVYGGAKLEAFRADEEPGPGAITPDIVDYLALAPIVVADISGKPNANVFYELGVRHSLNSPTIIIRQATPGVVPFDVHDARHFAYRWPGTTSSTNSFRSQMRRALCEAVEHPDRPDSIVARVLDSHPDIWEKGSLDAGSREEPLLRHERIRAQAECKRLLKAIGDAFRLHAQDYDGLFPRVENWRETIVPYLTAVQRDARGRPVATHCYACRRGETDYAMNSHLSSANRLSVTRPEHVPMVFDATIAQDADGGLPGSARHPRGNNVLFADGSVKSVLPEHMHRLKWEP